MLPLPELRQHPGLFALLLETAEGAFKRLVPLDRHTRHPFYTPLVCGDLMSDERLSLLKPRGEQIL
jgi:hypothetical protein